MTVATVAGMAGVGSGTAVAEKPSTSALPDAEDSRLEGVRQEMDIAVWLGGATRAQADRFTAQIEDRIARGL